MVMTLWNLAELAELFPTNSPDSELGTGANASELGGAAELRGRWLLGEGKNEDILGAVTYGKTAGEAEIAGSQVELRPSNIAKKMTIDTAAQNLVTVAMDSWEFQLKLPDKYSDKGVGEMVKSLVLLLCVCDPIFGWMSRDT